MTATALAEPRIRFDDEPSVCGIDCGLDGAIVFLSKGDVRLHVMPTLPLQKSKRTYDANEIRRILAEAAPRHVFVERQQAMPAGIHGRNQGAASTFSTGYGFGLIVGLLAGLQIPFTLVAPRTWQGRMLADMPKGDTKSVARVVAKRLFPGLDLRATARCRVDHGGIVDALLIAVHGERTLGALG